MTKKLLWILFATMAIIIGLYPILYLLFILLRGNNSGFYPYPFVNVPKIGLEKALVNSAATLLLAIILLIVLILIGRVKYKKFQKVQL